MKVALLGGGAGDGALGSGRLGSAEPCRFLVAGPVEAVQFISDGEALGLQLPALQLEPDVPLAGAASKGQRGRGLLESQPLIRAPPDAMAPLSSCASEMQHKWPHAPVECTELDLQKFSTQAEFVGGERPEDQAARRIPAEADGAGREGARRPLSVCPNPTAESEEQPVSSSGLRAPPNTDGHLRLRHRVLGWPVG